MEKLVASDKEGDCLHPLAELLPELELDAQKVDVIRTLGRDKLPHQWMVGFALETEDQRFRALAKLDL